MKTFCSASETVIRALNHKLCSESQAKTSYDQFCVLIHETTYIKSSSQLFNKLKQNKILVGLIYYTWPIILTPLQYLGKIVTIMGGKKKILPFFTRHLFHMIRISETDLVRKSCMVLLSYYRLAMLVNVYILQTLSLTWKIMHYFCPYGPVLSWCFLIMQYMILPISTYLLILAG